MTNPVMMTVHIMYVDVIVFLHALIMLYSTYQAGIGVKCNTLSNNGHVQFVASTVVSWMVSGLI